MILGIDLGTTYSVGAYLDEKGEPKVITNMEGSQITPSVVYFESKNSYSKYFLKWVNNLLNMTMHVLII